MEIGYTFFPMDFKIKLAEEKGKNTFQNDSETSWFPYIHYQKANKRMLFKMNFILGKVNTIKRMMFW